MAGVMSLMQPQGQQGPMPGQAPQQPMPGMMPQQGAATPGAMTSQLKNMPLEQLRMFLMNPQPNSPPLWAVISAVAEKQKEAQAIQMAQGQQVMAQNQQMQQQPPVAAQVVQAAEQMEEPVMAAHGGEMHSYAGGGAVAFQTAGAVPPGLLNPDVDEDGLPRGKDEREQIIDYNNKVRAAYEQQMKAKAAAGPRTAAPSMRDIAGVMAGRRQLEQFYKPRDPEAYTPEMVGFRVGETAPTPASTAPMRMQDTRGGTPEMAALAQMLGGAATAPSPAPAAPRRQPAAGPAPAAPLTPTAGISPEMEAYFRNRQSELRTRQGLPEDIVAGRAGLEALARESIAAQRGEAETFGREAREQRDAALARARRSVDPRELLALAGSIDTRRGQGIGSLARGAAGLMGQREAAAEAARKEYATAQQTERMLQANVRQATMLEAQRAQALREGDFNRANQIKDQIDALMMQRETLLMERRDKAIEQARLERGLNIQERGVRAQEISAAKPTGTVALLRELGLAPTLENVAKLAEVQQGPKSSAAIRKELVEQWSKNIMLQQKFPNFEDFVAAMVSEAGAAAAGAGEFKVLSSRPK